MGCQTLRKSQVTKTQSGTQNVAPTLAPAEVLQIKEGVPPPPDGEETDAASSSTEKVAPKIGIIFGPGGMRTYAYISFLRELEKNKVDVYAVSGVEFGALIAALYAQKGSVNDLEWQMYKFKDEDLLKKNLFGKNEFYSSLSEKSEKFKSLFTISNIQDFRIGFSCPSHSVKQARSYIFGKSEVTNTLLRCLSYPPFFSPYDGYVAAPFYINELVDNLKSKGVNYVIYLNVLNYQAISNDLDYPSQVLWSEILENLNDFKGINRIVNLDLPNYDILNINKRREIQQKSRSSAAEQVQKLVKDLSL